MTIIFSIPDARLNKAANSLESVLKPDFRDEKLVQRCLQKRVLRTEIFNEALNETVRICLYVALLLHSACSR